MFQQFQFLLILRGFINICTSLKVLDAVNMLILCISVSIQMYKNICMNLEQFCDFWFSLLVLLVLYMLERITVEHKMQEPSQALNKSKNSQSYSSNISSHKSSPPKTDEICKISLSNGWEKEEGVQSLRAIWVQTIFMLHLFCSCFDILVHNYVAVGVF